MAGRHDLYVYWINGSYVVRPPTVSVIGGQKLSICNYLEEEEVKVTFDPALGTTPKTLTIAPNSHRKVKIPGGAAGPVGVFGDNAFEILFKKQVVGWARGASDPVIIVDPSDQA
jgi:hypothetical protein